MKVIIENLYLEHLYNGDVLKGKPKFSKEVTEKFKKKIELIKSVENIAELKQFRSLNFEALSGNLKGKYSIRIDLKYRLILRIEKGEITIEEVLIVEDLTNHYQ